MIFTKGMTMINNFIPSSLLSKNYKYIKIYSSDEIETSIIGSTAVLLDVMRPSEEEMESKDNPIVSYIVSPYYMYDKSKYPQFLSGSGSFHFPWLKLTFIKFLC